MKEMLDFSGEPMLYYYNDCKYVKVYTENAWKVCFTPHLRRKIEHEFTG